MSGYRKRSLQRVDLNAKGLIEDVKTFGGQYLPLNTIIDGVVLHRGRIFLVDWKQAKAPRTVAQNRLVESGWPVHFIEGRGGLMAMLGL